MRQIRIFDSITQRNDLLNKYLSDIDKYPLLSIQEEIELWERSLKWDMEARDQLVQSNLRFVVSVAKQYQNQWMSLIDLINEWNIGLTKAAERFDPTKWFKFISYAVWRIRQAILSALASDGAMIRKPISQITPFNTISKINQRFLQEHYRDATSEELAELLGSDQNKVEKLLLDKISVQSYDIPRDTQDSDSASMFDTLSSQDVSDKNVNLTLLRASLEAAMTQLSVKQREVISMMYGLNDTNICYNPTQIAEKLSSTSTTIKKIEATAKQILKNFLLEEWFDQEFLQLFD